MLVICTGLIWAGDGQIDIATLPFTISSSGSYVVVKDLSLSTQDINGITISADNVTIDLNGHSLTGPGKSTGTTGSGIYIEPTHYNIAIHNGTLLNWRRDGIYGEYSANCQFENLRCYNTGLRGLYAGSESRVVGNTCSQNADVGIRTGPGCYVNGNVCSNGGNIGLNPGNGSTVSGNTCSNNTSDGIYAQAGCQISNNSSTTNGGEGIQVAGSGTIVNNSCISNSGSGIYAGASFIYGNNCLYNTKDGILASSNSKVMNNNCVSNGYPTGDGAGINVVGSDSCIENNLVTNNDRGIDCNPGTGNYIASNRASGNTTNYDILGSNTQGTGDLSNVAF
jgi:parallel beta-helix repeat protein